MRLRSRASLLRSLRRYRQGLEILYNRSCFITVGEGDQRIWIVILQTIYELLEKVSFYSLSRRLLL